MNEGYSKPKGKAITETDGAYVWSRTGENSPYGILEGMMETKHGWDTKALAIERGRNRYFLT